MASGQLWLGVVVGIMLCSLTGGIFCSVGTCAYVLTYIQNTPSVAAIGTASVWLRSESWGSIWNSRAARHAHTHQPGPSSSFARGNECERDVCCA